MQFFKELFKSKEQKEAEAIEVVERLLAERLAQEEEMRKALREEVHAARMASPVPWFEPNIEAEVDAPISDRYNWNNAFIEDLKKRGYVGKTAENIIEDYLQKQEETETKRLIELERDEKRKSSEPWVEVIGEKMDKEGLIELQLDWNDAFIHYLKQHGFRGATDDAIVQLWLISLDKSMEGSQYQ